MYGTIFKIIKLPRTPTPIMRSRDHHQTNWLFFLEMKTFILILLIAKIGFIANESITGLKLLEKGFRKEDLALTVLIDFPFQLLFGYYAAKWSTGPRPLRPASTFTYLFYLIDCSSNWAV